MTSTTGYQEIAAGVYWLEVGRGYDRSNVYFIRSELGWVLIDTASKHSEQIIRTVAASLFGVNTRPVAILLTHDHPDHAGGVRELVQMWGSPVYIHPDEWPIVALKDLATLEQYANPLDRRLILPILHMIPRRRAEAMLARDNLESIVQVFDPAGMAPGLPEWTCVPTPGHSPGHVAFFRNRDRTLISGDALVTADLNSWRNFLLWMLHRSTAHISNPPWYSTWNRPLAAASMTLLAALEPRVVASGHGVPLVGEGVPEAMRAFVDSGDPLGWRDCF